VESERANRNKETYSEKTKTIQSLKEDKISFRNKLILYLMNNSFYIVSEFVEHNLNN
jgi:hypothetical protein